MHSQWTCTFSFFPTPSPRATGFLGKEAPKYNDMKKAEANFSPSLTVLRWVVEVRRVPSHPVSWRPTRAVLLKFSLFNTSFFLFPICPNQYFLFVLRWSDTCTAQQCQIDGNISRCLFAISVLISTLIEICPWTTLSHVSLGLCPSLNVSHWITGLCSNLQEGVTAERSMHSVF